MASRAGQASDSRDIVSSGDAVSGGELGQHRGVGEGEGARVGEAVGDTGTAEVVGAGGLAGGVVDGVDGGGIAILVDGADVAEDVALGQDVGALTDLETVAAGLVPLGRERSISNSSDQTFS